MPSDLLQFPIMRVNDNRLQGLLRELAEAIEQDEDPANLRNLAVSLKSMSDVCRELAWTMDKSRW